MLVRYFWWNQARRITRIQGRVHDYTACLLRLLSAEAYVIQSGHVARKYVKHSSIRSQL
jgi:hypothetical protein